MPEPLTVRLPLPPLRTFSYGGGVQSIAALVLAARGEIDFPVFLFANVGDDSENPTTLAYVREVARPYAEAHGITLHELRRTKRDGSQETLYGRLTRPDSRSAGIPARLAGSGAPANRSCTAEFKIRVIARWQREHGATPSAPAQHGLGISLDEYQRMRSDSGIPYQTLAYPLIDRRLTRADCVALIAAAGLPVPPKSSCWFCPYHRLTEWRRMKREQPDLFTKAVELEELLSARGQRLGWGAMYFTSRMIPLRQLVGDSTQLALAFEEEDACESGFCMV